MTNALYTIRPYRMGTVWARPRPGHPGWPTSPILAPNDVWTADFKGHFALGAGGRCHPLTIVDRYSRYLLACHALRHPTSTDSQGVFTRVGSPPSASGG